MHAPQKTGEKLRIVLEVRFPSSSMSPPRVPAGPIRGRRKIIVMVKKPGK